MKAHNSTLNRGTSQLKRTPLKRGRKKTYKTKAERQLMVNELVADRGSYCERCGRPISSPNRFNDHHVIPKRKPYNGPDHLWNRKLLCSGWASDWRYARTGCHEFLESHPNEARKEGYLCPKGYRYKEGEDE